jgi:hypothetical protein
LARPPKLTPEFKLNVKIFEPDGGPLSSGLITGCYKEAGMAFAILAEKIARIAGHWHDRI